MSKAPRTTKFQAKPIQYLRPVVLPRRDDPLAVIADPKLLAVVMPQINSEKCLCTFCALWRDNERAASRIYPFDRPSEDVMVLRPRVVLPIVIEEDDDETDIDDYFDDDVSDVTDETYADQFGEGPRYIG